MRFSAMAARPGCRGVRDLHGAGHNPSATSAGAQWRAGGARAGGSPPSPAAAALRAGGAGGGAGAATQSPRLSNSCEQGPPGGLATAPPPCCDRWPPCRAPGTASRAGVAARAAWEDVRCAAGGRAGEAVDRLHGRLQDACGLSTAKSRRATEARPSPVLALSRLRPGDRAAHAQDDQRQHPGADAGPMQRASGTTRRAVGIANARPGRGRGPDRRGAHRRRRREGRGGGRCCQEQAGAKRRRRQAAGPMRNASGSAVRLDAPRKRGDMTRKRARQSVEAAADSPDPATRAARALLFHRAPSLRAAAQR